MKAAQINDYGGIDVITIDDIPTPELKPGQILVENHSSSINPVDIIVRSGVYRDKIPLKLPFILGSDFAGKVVEVAEDVSGFAIRDEVYGQGIILNGSSGAFAELIAVNASNTAMRPQSMIIDETGVAPLVGVSALQAIEDNIKLKSGQRILIHGGTGGIGHLAIQIAKAIGAYVATTVSSRNVDFALGLGADEVINYESEYFGDKLKEFDAVFDTVGGDYLEKSLSVLKKGGILVSMLGKPDEALSNSYNVTTIAQNTIVDTEHLERLSRLLDSGKVKVYIDNSYSLDDIQEAFMYQEEAKVKGKVAIKIVREEIL